MLAIADGYDWQRFLRMADEVLSRRGDTWQPPLAISGDKRKRPPNQAASVSSSRFCLLCAFYADAGFAPSIEPDFAVVCLRD